MRFMRLIKFIHYGSTLQKFTNPKLEKKLYHKIMFSKMLSEIMVIQIQRTKHITLPHKIFISI